MPAGAGSPRALRAATRAAAAGSCEAAWLRTRYLLDLFDYARLLPDRSSAELGLLWRALRLPGEPSRGELATRQLLTALQRTADAIPRQCARQRTRHGRDLRQLLGADRASRETPAQALEVVVTYKQLARSPSPVAPNAALRLTDWCAQAFRLAAGGLPALQHRRLAQCLYPLFPADARPYFVEDPTRRPPDPPWTLLRDALSRARAQLLGTRLGALARRLAAADARFFRRAASALPLPLDLSRVELIRSTAGRAWDRTPVVLVTDRGYLVGGRAVLRADEDGLVRAMEARLRNDRRATVTIVAPPDAPADRVLEVGRAARQAGARTLELGVARRVASRPPPGDVQARVFDDGPVLRLEGITAYLGLLSARAVPPAPRHLPRGMGYDPRTASASVAALIGRSGVVVASKDGRLGPVKLRDLRATVASLRRIYPEDRSIVLAPGRDALYRDLVAVAARVRTDEAGAPLLPGVALTTQSRVVAPTDDLAPVVRLLGRARVAVEPELSRTWARELRRCYHRALRDTIGTDRAAPSGTIVLRWRGGKLRAGRGSLRSRPLRRCVVDRLTPPNSEKKIKITATFFLAE